MKTDFGISARTSSVFCFISCAWCTALSSCPPLPQRGALRGGVSDVHVQPRVFAPLVLDGRHAQPPAVQRGQLPGQRLLLPQEPGQSVAVSLNQTLLLREASVVTRDELPLGFDQFCKNSDLPHFSRYVNNRWRKKTRLFPEHPWQFGHTDGRCWRV